MSYDCVAIVYLCQELPGGYGRVKPDIVTYGSSVRGSALQYVLYTSVIFMMLIYNKILYINSIVSSQVCEFQVLWESNLGVEIDQRAVAEAVFHHFVHFTYYSEEMCIAIYHFLCSWLAVGLRLLVGHIYELWLNDTSEACSYY